MSIALYRKYRPRNLSEVVGQDHIKKTIKNTVKSGRDLPHAILFTGPQGTGKTTLARIIACIVNSDPYSTEYNLDEGVCKDILNGACPDISEIDAAYSNSIDDVRQLRVTAKHSPMICNRRVFIVDECHMWKKDAANCLLKILEEPPSSTMFVLATTESQKIIPTIKSRCQRFDLNKLLMKDISVRLKEICEKENIETVSESSLNMIARSAGGKMRDAISVLESVIGRCGDNITEDQVAEVIGVVDQKIMLNLLQSIMSASYKDAVFNVRKALATRLEPENIFQGFQKYCHDMLVARCLESHKHLYISPEIKDKWVAQMESTPPLLLSKIIDRINHFTSGINYNPSPEASLDACIVEIVSIVKKQKQKT